MWLAEQRLPASPRLSLSFPPHFPFSLVVKSAPTPISAGRGWRGLPGGARATGPGPGGGGLGPPVEEGRPPPSTTGGEVTHAGVVDAARTRLDRDTRDTEKAGQSHATGHHLGPQRRNKGHFLWKCIVERPSAAAAVPRARV